ncbi:RNA-directed DNA polymerase [Listeria sp. FSL L7-0253]|uniref:RNA-directed DNA polymerase n=1 Tax=Listeria cossartiae TaxID=2838249 RepID=UPI001627AEB0|nr:RNA-directed DNA polymerase [Listeria cossartiae]MBC2186509.1 RNA-directed DNA polymerase [Listeria cossartiae subsp. cossartiae]
MKSIPKINKDNRIIFNPNVTQRKEYHKTKKEIEKKYSISLPSRDFIIKQLISTLTHGDLKAHKVLDIDLIIIRSDIKNFYPSINKHLLYKKLKKANILSQHSFDILKPMFFSNSIKGVPLGLSFSSHLAEIYLEQFDQDINFEFMPSFYYRYVDDVIIIKYDTLNITKPQIIHETLSNIFSKNHLHLNANKTNIIHYSKSNEFDFSYLGYQFKVVNDKLLISISEAKLKKIINKIKNYFYLFKKSNRSDLQFWQLNYRIINCLYGITSTNENNKKIKFGLGYSYRFINDEEQILYLISIVKGLIHSCNLNQTKRAVLFNTIKIVDSPLNFLNKRMNYTKISENRLKQLNARLNLDEQNKNLSKIFFYLYRNIKN